MGCAQSSPSSASKAEGHPEAVIQALSTLRDHLEHLTPADQTTVKHRHKFATAEWLEGLAALTKTTVDKEKGHSIKPDQSVHAGDQRAFNESRMKLTPDSNKLILILVGLPARGKSLLGHKLETYLNWRGYRTKTFRVGMYRRSAATNGDDSQSGHGVRSAHTAASFFDSKKAYASATREAVAMDGFSKLLDWLDDDGQIAIFDATNCTKRRRDKLKELAKARGEYGMVHIESIVTDPATIMAGMRWKVAHSPDFMSMSEDEGMKDLMERIGHYEAVYETVTEEEGAYIKLFDLRAKVSACNIFGRMATKVLPYLLGIHSVSRPVYLLPLLPGNDQASVADMALVDRAIAWAKALPNASTLQIFCSRQARCKEIGEGIAQAVGCSAPMVRVALNPFDPTVDASPVAQRRNSKGDMSSFRAERSTPESVLASRLDPVAVEVESNTAPCLVISHDMNIASLRALMLGLATKQLREKEDLKAASNEGNALCLEGDVKYEKPFGLEGAPAQASSSKTIIELLPNPVGGYEEKTHPLNTK